MNVENFKKELQTKCFGKEMFFFDEIDSTNTFAKRLAIEGKPEGTLVLAEYQSNGRGRIERTWISSKKKNLLFTFILRPQFSGDTIGLLQLMFAVAMCETLRTFDIFATTKWPNDILLNGKKICGMLLESSFGGENVEYILVGIGLNIQQENFPGEIQSVASSLLIETKQHFDRWEILKTFLSISEKHYLNFSHITAEKIIEQWKSFSAMLSKNVQIAHNGNIFWGKAIDISPRGELVVAIDSAIQYFSSADVSILHH